MGIDAKYGRVTVERPNTIGEDEPVIVFRAQDKLLVPLMDAYVSLCGAAGSPARHMNLIQSTRETVRAWQAEHHTQVPQSASMPET